MNVLVLGAGLIGCETVRQLIAAGSEPVLADINPDAESIRLAVGMDCATERVDISSREQLSAIVKKYNIASIINLAAQLTQSADRDPVSAVRTNVNGVTHLLEMQRIGDLDRIVCASSTTVTYSLFDRPLESPIPKDFSMRVISQHPGSIYATTKLMGEMLALAYKDRYSTVPVFLRFGAVLGRWPTGPKSIPSRLLEIFREAAIRKACAVIDDPLVIWNGIEEFVDVRDTARANMCALEAQAPDQAIYHITSGEAVTVDQVIKMVREFYPDLEIQLRVSVQGALAGFPNPRPSQSDIRAAQREIGFVPKFMLRDSIATYLNG
jgi:UDP-glucose 4-epimerase